MRLTIVESLGRVRTTGLSRLAWAILGGVGIGSMFRILDQPGLSVEAVGIVLALAAALAQQTIP